MENNRGHCADQFLAVLRHLDELLSSAVGTRSYESLADAYDLSAAKDSVERFARSGVRSDFKAGERRFLALVERSPSKKREEGRKLLFQLADLAATLSEPELRAVSESWERESPGGNTAVDRTKSADVLVVAAMFEPELSAFLDRISPIEDFVGTEKSGLPEITYFVGSLRAGGAQTQSLPISVAALFLSRTGLTDCASLVASGIRVFRPRLVAMTGVCAGRRALGVRKNDIIVPASSFTYDSGKYTDDGFEREPHWAEASTRVIQRVRSLGGSVIDEVMDQLSASLPARVRRPRIHYDVMACGSSVVDKEGMIDEIAGATRKVVGLDMESYAFMRSATLTDPGVPRIVVKSVMDFSTGKSDAVKSQAAFWAASFLTGLIRRDFERLVRG